MVTMLETPRTSEQATPTDDVLPGVLGAVSPAVRLGVDLVLVVLLLAAVLASVAALRLVWQRVGTGL
ncbi:MAG: hypothetical protein MUE34_16745 [Acidimicrobiales bacterium]|nr:hypothetical protein [Acidimicrobiales bacterium]